jgi:hypothetical protein
MWGWFAYIHTPAYHVSVFFLFPFVFFFLPLFCFFFFLRGRNTEMDVVFDFTHGSSVSLNGFFAAMRAQKVPHRVVHPMSWGRLMARLHD